MQTEPRDEILADSEPAAEAEDAQTAGEILVQARQRLGLNEKEVADQLHITMHYVKALESNSYEKLPGAVFTKGYLKSYGELLGLDVEDLVSRYDVINNRQQADVEEASRLVKAQKKKDRNKPLVIVSLLIFVGGFLALWIANSLFGEDTGSTPAAVADAAGRAEPAPALSSSRAAQPEPAVPAQPEQAPERIASPPPVSPRQELQSEPLASAQTQPAELAEQEADDSAPQQDLESILQALAAEQAAIASADGPDAAAAEPEQPRVLTIATAGTDVLRMSFSGESWVEVNDSESQQIYRDIREAGDVLEITGTAPFNILLGDASFARLSLNGDEIDLSSDIRIDNSARLTVGL